MARKLYLFGILIFLVFIFQASSKSDKFDFIYSNISVEVPTYQDEIAEFPSREIFNETLNQTVLYSSFNITRKIIIGYTTVEYEDKKIGIKIKNKDKEIYGAVNVENDTLVTWSVPIGDRNMNEFGRCREYEKEKGVCWETNLTQ